jgi:hypothetical protein
MAEFDWDKPATTTPAWDKPQQSILGEKKEKKEKPGFIERFGETFQPVKAITEEGIIPQLGQYAKRKFTGEPAPKAEEQPERPMSMKESFNQVVDFAKKDPGAFAGTLANAIVADPELLFVPEFLPARVLSAIEKTSKLGAATARTASASTNAAAMAAAQSAARQLNERGTVDMNVLRNEAQNAAAMGGGVRVLGETARYVAPGAKAYASEGTQDLLRRAREKGYALPIGEMSPVGAIIDKYYQSPRRAINEETFYKQVTTPTGTQVKEINAKTLPKIEANLDNEITGIMSNQKVSVPSNIKDTLQTFLPYQKGRIEATLDDIANNRQISGKDWHDVRSELGKRAANARQSNPLMAQDIDNVISAWDAYAKASLPAPVIDSFNRWKGHYTAYKDIDTAIHASPTAYNNYLNGVLEPQDLMTAIKSRRPAEAQEPFGAKTRGQTYTGALGSGLNLLGKEPVPTTFFGALPKVATGAVAKPLQALGYTPAGQSLLYQGVPFTGLAPEVGYAAEKTAQQRRK